MKKRILLICGFFNTGGSSLYSYEIANQLKDKYDFVFMGHHPGPMMEKFEKIGDVVLVKNRVGFNYSVSEISPIINKFNPHVCHICIPGSQDITYPLYIFSPTICTVLCEQQIGFDYTLFNKILFLSEYNKNFQHVQYDNYEVIRPGISDPIRTGRPTNKRSVFGRISAFCPSKKILDTVKCAAKVPNLFIIAGEILSPEYYNTVVNYIKSNNIRNVQIIPNIFDYQKHHILQSINILHYPTSSETFCFSILEGMAYGLPILSYNNSAIPEFNHQNNIELCNNLDELMVKTREYSNMTSKELHDKGNINRQTYERNYSGRRFAMDISRVYEEAS